MILCTIVAIVFPNITSVLSILGGLCSCTMSYLIPMLAYVRTSDKPWYGCYNLTLIIFFGTLTMIGYIAVCLTVFMLATGEHIVGNRPDLHPEG